jgi:zinc protease
MIEFKKKVLENGLTVIIHEDDSSPLVAINLLYKVGSKNEPQDKTGLTHLFEHLMFSGSKHIPDFDNPIQLAGGENNAFTNADITNFYIVLPSENIEIGLWLEADRMNRLKLTKKALDTQKKVVIEEFKETCLNEPYGDAWHHLSDMAYPTHPYKSPTIGKEISHIEKIEKDDAKTFYQNFYAPNNAILSICGNIKNEEGFLLAEKWFNHIKGGVPTELILSDQDVIDTSITKTVQADVPSNGLYLAFKMANRLEYNFYLSDLLSDILSSGRSSRLYQRLVKDRQLFSYLDAYISGTTDPGLLVIDGRLADNISIEEARTALWKELYEMGEVKMEDTEMTKIKNKAETNLLFSEIGIANKAMSLGYFEYLGNINLINEEVDIYNKITSEEILQHAKSLFSSPHIELIYQKNNQ